MLHTRSVYSEEICRYIFIQNVVLVLRFGPWDKSDCVTNKTVYLLAWKKVPDG